MEIKLKVEIDFAPNLVALLLTGVKNAAANATVDFPKGGATHEFPAFDPETDAGKPTTPPAEEKKLTAAEKKKLKAAEEAAAEKAAAAKKNGADDLTGASSEKKEITKDDLIAATQNAVFRNAENRDKIRSYLDEAVVEKVTELPKKDWPIFLQFAEEL
jgi:hypothetical protein